jgi:hypothetical protein
LDGPAGARYTVHLEQEPRFVAAGSPKLELTADLPEALGSAIAAGAWARALEGASGAPAQRLHAVLQELAVPPAEVGPRLSAEHDREHYDVSDKGRNWFELDRESWRFRLFAVGAEPPELRFEEVVIDARIGGEEPELFRRVHSMREFVRMIPGLRPLDRAPHERAIEALAHASAS